MGAAETRPKAARKRQTAQQAPGFSSRKVYGSSRGRGDEKRNIWERRQRGVEDGMRR